MPTKKPKTIATIADLTPDPRNANRGTERGAGMVETSLRSYGAGRSILADRNGVIIAGNKTLEQAAALGLPVEMIHTSGDRLVVVVRDDLDLSTDITAKELAIVDNRSAEVGLEWDSDVIRALVDDGVDVSGFWTDDELRAVLVADTDEPVIPEQTGDKPSLMDRFLIPPFSVLDARQGYWQDRKRQWIGIGIQSELGRGENAAIGGSPLPLDRHPATANPGPARTFGQDLMRGEHVVGQNTNRLTYVKGDRTELDDTSARILAGGRRKKPDTRAFNDHDWQREKLGKVQAPSQTNGGTGPLTWTGAAREFDHYRVKEGERETTDASGTSIFDPVLCEIVYRWFCPPAGVVLDPFAGGSVRGIVAAQLGRDYVGIDLSAPQLQANERQAAAICTDRVPTWIHGDSNDVDQLIDQDRTFDLLFTCPPYADLEVYSDDPRDLSTMPYQEFLIAYRSIIARAVQRLNDDRFAVFVVGDIRDGKGLYRNFVSDTIAAFHDAGMRLYNEAILVTAVGSLPIRVGKQFEATRKLGKTHQNVLGFVKGDPKRATAACGVVDVSGAFAAASIGDDEEFVALAAARFAETASDE